MEGLEFAINMELQGERYYRKQASLNKDNVLGTVFSGLADDERAHAGYLSKEAKGTAFAASEAGARSVFDSLADFKAVGTAEQLDAYREALDMEKQSIELYQNLLRQSEGQSALFEFLIAQEKEHYRIIGEIIRLVNRPNEWVESAEFGRRREEY